MHILCYIESEQDNGRDVFQRDIEDKLNVRPSTATSILKVLEKNGYLVRESVKSDARLKKLVLTPKADEIKAVTFDMISEVEKQIISDITPDELDLFFKVLDKMKNNLMTNPINDKTNNN